MKVLLLSAYDAGSHKRWRRGLVAAIPDWDWTVLTLPPRYFSWRVRGNSLSWGRGEQATILHQDWDLIVATSMTDVSALRGLVPEIARVPTAVYFHENQFAYPRTRDAFQSVEPQLLNIYTALSGDLLLFNSDFNRRSLLKGARQLLKRFPDHVPGGICEEVEAKSHVLPVPLEDNLFTRESPLVRPASGPLVISWAARWEYDKGPDRLLQILEGLEAQGIDYRLNLLGESFRSSPEQFQEIRERFSSRLGAVGFQASAGAYRQVLQESHVFLSTAYHEFQGLAVMEACALGCSPVVPDEQAYPDLYAREYRYGSTDKAVEMLAELACARRAGESLPSVDVSGFRWAELAPRYRRSLEKIVAIRN
ncbi:DUF3524 domain-containing protein [Microbulbifer flavimaris]|uniref:tRNA-queuosine alpha-mannosyltransferase n=1 Tax=Microbulbifer flavimaris TaxID=1781068 RepID=A0ABX4I2A7_9GAMM|nr:MULTISPECIES: DUF3524 domain-containing protein [Microbulbifer]KUJ84382.1 glycosyl transferase family 1 [Microbulbifer sp. ZGT114]PCO06466.1 DUF3524 domain-containing protein [Microbulbifer flavimaris]